MRDLARGQHLWGLVTKDFPKGHGFGIVRDIKNGHPKPPIHLRFRVIGNGHLLDRHGWQQAVVDRNEDEALVSECLWLVMNFFPGKDNPTLFWFTYLEANRKKLPGFKCSMSTPRPRVRIIQ
jgi:hypothetical protein